MVDNGEGMTRTCNRFHDLYETGPCIAELRDLHAVMDRAVLNAYDWSDLPTDCDFLLDYAIDEAPEAAGRYPAATAWPDTVRDEVLARLIAFNADRVAKSALAANHYRYSADRQQRCDDLTRLPKPYNVSPSTRYAKSRP